MGTVVRPSHRHVASAVADHHPLGISSGIFYREHAAWPELVRQAREFSTYAAEFSALAGDELPALVSFLTSVSSLPFRYVSVHAPAKDFDEQAVVAQLARLPRLVGSIVVHPDVFSRPGAYSVLGRRIVIENMDERKADGRTAPELSRFFDANPQAGFCFDVAHAWSVDPTMDLAHELLDHYGPRLRQVHLSTLSHDGEHLPLDEEHEELFSEVLARCTDVPWILEAPAPARWATGPVRRRVSSLRS